MVEKMLETLRLVPDDVILAVATREIKLDSAFHCVCAYIAKELWSIEQNVDVEEVKFPATILEGLDKELGGGEDAWYTINTAYITPEESEALELAFVDRLNECVQS